MINVNEALIKMYNLLKIQNIYKPNFNYYEKNYIFTVFS